MFSPFHILKVQSDGSLRWKEGALSVARAKARVTMLAASSPGEYVITNLTGEMIPVKSPAKQTVFQIEYDEKDLSARAEFFRRVGYEVLSVSDNDAAKRALCSIQKVDVFVVGRAAPEQTREEIVDWLKASFPNVKVVALIPPASRNLPHADYNVVLNGLDEWLSLLAAATS